MTSKKNPDDIAEVELVYHNKKPSSERPKISGSADAYNALINTWDKNKLELQEQFRVLLLDQQNSCLGVSTIAMGGIADCMVDLKLVFALALKAHASAIILSHNHPSGNVKFSEADRRLTSQFQKAGELLQIKVLDHILVTKDGHLSMSDTGAMPS